MSPGSDEHGDEEARYAELLSVIFSFAAGDLSARGNLSGDDTSLDGITAGINILGEELEAYIAKIDRSENVLRGAARYSRSLIEGGLDPMLVVDMDGRITDVNEAATRMTGLPRDQLIGSHFPEPSARAQLATAVAETLANGAVRNLAMVIKDAAGTQTEVLCNTSLLHDGHGHVSGVLAVARDIAELRRAERAEEIARHDGLTDLYNHRAFYSLLDDEISRSNRSGRPISLLMLDIDHFKVVNDTHGHPAGDVVLRLLSRILVTESRAIDRVCRYGGEEFVVIMPETNASAATKLGERLRAAVERTPFDIGNAYVSVTISIGVATYPRHVDSLDGLVVAADSALYSAKRGGRNRVNGYARRSDIIAEPSS